MDIRLSKTLAFALRHKPWVYELELDDEGWVSVPQLLAALREERPAWRDLNEADLQDVVQHSSKQRYEIRDGLIRALYGHSQVNSVRKQPAAPPEELFHGTSEDVLEIIEHDGLKPMSRQYVHLSVDLKMAQLVAQRKSGKIVILKVDAGLAYRNGIAFYKGNDKVWLADSVPPVYLNLNNHA